VWFVFFDGEEALVEWTSLDSLYGSREFVSLLKRRGVLKDVAALILLDLVGEKDLVLRRDSNSTAWLTDIIWEEAARLGYSSIFREGWIGAGDDHIPFAEAGVPVVDIIDLDYIYWHTEHDTLDKVHAPNLRIVGEVVLSALPKVVARRAGSGRLP
jgi:Zn-dependent M28 family amino/carboxypeptidase